MAISRSVLLVAAICAVDCTAQEPGAKISGASSNHALPRGWGDIHIEAQESVVGRFAGFFDVTLRTTQTEDGTVTRTDLERGSIALTFREFGSKHATIDQPTGFSGMIVLGRDKIPFPINLTARQRTRGNLFNVSLSGITDSDSIGVATIDGETITIRLVDDGPGTTVLNLQRQSSLDEHTAPKADKQIDFGPVKPYVPNGLPSTAS